jgi:hypothetical protein
MSKTPIIIGVVVLLLVVIGVVMYFTMMKGEEPVAVAPTAVAPAAPVVPPPPTEYVYEFIKNVESAHTEDFNVHITDIRMDGVRVTPEQIVLHEEPTHTKCNSKTGGYQCESGNYGLNDPEPANPTYTDLTWSAWKEGQIPVGSKVFTITTPTKVGEFEIDYFRPKYAPGWIIKENGVEVLKETVNGGTGDTPTPKKIKYIIP